MFFVRQGATHKVVMGPAVAVGDGFTPVTTLALSTADEAEVILHDNATVVDISAYTWAAITTADGYYHLTLQTGISNTVGHMTVVVNDDSLCLPLRGDFTILEEAVYDQMFASTAPGAATVAALATAQTDLDTLTGADGATLATSQPNYAPATAAALTTHDGKLDTVDANIDTLLTRITSTLFSGITSLAEWLGLIAGKQAGDVTAVAEIKLTGAGSGTYDPTTDSNEAIRDNMGTAQTGDNFARLGAPAGASVSADIAAAKVDTAAILIDTAEIGAAGAGLTAVPWNAAWDAEVQSEVDDALNTAIAELGVAAPTATPTIRTAIMLMYMALRNKLVVQTSGTDAIEIYNDAGTKIASKLITDDGADYTEAEMA